MIIRIIFTVFDRSICGATNEIQKLETLFEILGTPLFHFVGERLFYASVTFHVFLIVVSLLPSAEKHLLLLQPPQPLATPPLPM